MFNQTFKYKKHYPLISHPNNNLIIADLLIYSSGNRKGSYSVLIRRIPLKIGRIWKNILTFRSDASGQGRLGQTRSVRAG